MRKLIWTLPAFVHSFVAFLTGKVLVRTQDEAGNLLNLEWENLTDYERRCDAR